MCAEEAPLEKCLAIHDGRQGWREGWEREKECLWGGETTALRGCGERDLLVISWTGLLPGLNSQAEEVTH